MANKDVHLPDDQIRILKYLVSIDGALVSAEGLVEELGMHYTVVKFHLTELENRKYVNQPNYTHSYGLAHEGRRLVIEKGWV